MATKYNLDYPVDKPLPKIKKRTLNRFFRDLDWWRHYSTKANELRVVAETDRRMNESKPRIRAKA